MLRCYGEGPEEKLIKKKTLVGDTLCNYVKEDIEFVKNCFGVTKKDQKKN